MNILYLKNKTNKTIFFIVLFVSVLFSNNVFAADQPNEEAPRSYYYPLIDFDIKVNKDSTVDVVEKETFRFDGEYHLGWRSLGLSKLDDITDIEVIDAETNTPLIYSTSRLDKTSKDSFNHYAVFKENDSQNIEWYYNEKDSAHTWIFKYKLHGAIGFFKDHEELYYNLIMNFNVPIERISATVSLPSDTVLGMPFTMYRSNTDAPTEKKQLDNRTFYFSTEKIFPGEAITIAPGWSKGIVLESSETKSIKSIIMNNIILILPIIVFLIMFFVWKKYGKDPKGYSTIIAQYEPPVGMKPTLVGSLVDERADFKDITAGLIYLAEQGFVKIKKLEKTWVFGYSNYELELLKNEDDSLEQVEKDILNTFFEYKLVIGSVIKISDLKLSQEFPWRIKDVLSSLYKEMKDKGYYVDNPKNIKTLCIGGALIFMFLCIFISAKTSHFLEMGMVLISGIIIIIFGSLMSKKTKLGAETKDYILGFKKFLSITEKDRFDFHNAPEKTPEQFMKFLPYAIALGVEKKWAEQFEGIYIEEPKWYKGNTVGAFAVTDFSSHISNMSQSFSTIAMGQSGAGGGSGGGGSAGGGGGGGGGGAS